MNVALKVRWQKFYPIIKLLGALGIALVLQRFPLPFLEGFLYDARVRLSPSPNVSGQIVTVVVDPKTQSALEDDPDVNGYKKVIEQIAAERPDAILIMDDPTHWAGTLAQKKEFAKLAANIPEFYFVTEQIAPLNPQQNLKLAPPYDIDNLASAPITRDNVTFAGDKVTRRILLSFEGQLLLQPILAQRLNHVIRPEIYRGAYESDGSLYSYIRYRRTGTYEPLSFVDVQNGQFSPGTFRSKIVIVGLDTQSSTDDYVLTPYSRYPLAMSRVEAQANVLDTLIQNNGIRRADDWFDFLLTLSVAYTTVLIVWSVPPVLGILMLLGQAGAFALFAYTLFAFGGLWVNMIHPFLAIFVSYYFFIPYRLIKENRKSWEFEQKNRLLTQVEELKTNFLSMMSHDLKTPIARIQGMAEIVLSNRERLDANQKEALQTIMRSSDELGRFISSILDLSRIESKEVKLHKSSRDINAVLKEVIKKYEFNAKQKNIKLEAQLEPLFSVKVDVDLIRQVFSNLVENAIKYSPDGSTVVIASQENGEFINVSVKDQGPGIAPDEVDNVFMKFYRSKAAKASNIKGSGLGLYLSKYFVELHDGKIGVETVPSQGSKFTVQLPLS